MLDGFKKVPFTTKVCFIIVVLMMLFVIFTSGREHKKEEIVVDKTKMIERFNMINNNYQLKVTKNLNGENENFTYYTDGNLELYETDSLDIGYIVYNNKTYALDSNTMKLSLVNEIPSFINDPYGNFKLIKSIINKCEFEHINTSTANCKVQEADFINAMNSFYNNKYDNYSLNYLDIKINYGDRINKLDIDYSNINSLLFGDNNSIAYEIKISNVGGNNFNEIYEYFKDELK